MSLSLLLVVSVVLGFVFPFIWILTPVFLIFLLIPTGKELTSISESAKTTAQGVADLHSYVYKRPCPFCNKSIKKDANICKHCNKLLPVRVKGLHVDSIRDGMALGRGIRVGDVIFMAEGNPISSNSDLKKLLDNYSGQNIVLSAIRENKLLDFSIKAGPLGVSCSEKTIEKPN